jgi:hypothetical protein
LPPGKLPVTREEVEVLIELEEQLARLAQFAAQQRVEILRRLVRDEPAPNLTKIRRIK